MPSPLQAEITWEPGTIINLSSLKLFLSGILVTRHKHALDFLSILSLQNISSPNSFSKALHQANFCPVIYCLKLQWPKHLPVTDLRGSSCSLLCVGEFWVSEIKARPQQSFHSLQGVTGMEAKASVRFLLSWRSVTGLECGRDKGHKDVPTDL